MAQKRYLDLAELGYLINLIKEGYVQKVTGKELTSNDFTNLFKEKLESIESGAEINKVELIKKNGTNLTIDGNKAVDITIPTKLSDFTNDATFQTKAEILTLISEKGKLKTIVVDVLPAIAEAEDNAIYFVPNDSGAGHIEWIAINGKWEMLGDTGEIDLSGYIKESDLVPITEAEILALFNA